MKVKSYILGQVMTNCYLLWDDVSKQAMLIDPGEFDEQIMQDIEKEGLSVKYIILTHTHFDHINGVKAFEERLGSTIAAHKLDAPGLIDVRVSMGMLCGYDTPQLPADVLLNEGDVLTLGAQEIRVIHTPGHTVGSISLYAGDMVFSGDTLFYKSIGRTDFPGGSFEALEKSIKDKLYRLPDTTVVYSGHGEKTTIGFEKGNNSYIK